MNLFKLASRQKFRFESAKGELSVEDLWALPLNAERGVSLESVAQTLYARTKASEGISFTGASPEKNAAAQLLQHKLDLVKEVIAERLLEKEAAQRKAALEAQRVRLLQLREKRQNEKDDQLSLEEIEQMLKNLGTP